ncbi:MAG: GNAT family N-acetyltransferase [Lachnospiraceae bacterium]|nr:GNAT family N-acetyltransferase [Lachnospiraceae bacterium]
MKLIEPTIEYEKQLYDYRKEFINSGSSMDGTGSFIEYESPSEWLKKVEAYKNPETVPEGFVPSTQFVFVREEDNKIVGMIQIRHCFNEYLVKYGGHIGYSVAPSERLKGYGSLMLKLTLPYCKKLGLSRVLITCVKGNIGSRKIILKNKGIYESTVYEPDKDVFLERYWIDL